MGKRKILIVDYEPRSIEHVRAMLELAGFEVQVAKDGVAGLKAFREIEPDLVLLEAMIPKKHGFEVCQEIKSSESGGDIPVVIHTGVYKGRKYRNQAIHQYGCDAYLEKPVADDVLLTKIREFLGTNGEAHGALEAEAPAVASAVPAPAKPSPAARPEAAPGAAAGGPTLPAEMADFSELEIMERLDSILDCGPEDESPALETFPEETQEPTEEAPRESEREEHDDSDKVVSFDASRKRRQETASPPDPVRTTTAVAAQPEPAAPQAPHEEPAPAPSREAVAEITPEPDFHSEPEQVAAPTHEPAPTFEPLTPPQKSRSGLWIALGLVGVAAAVFALLYAFGLI